MRNKIIRKIFQIAAVLVCFLLQTTLFQELSFVSVSPNLLIVVTAAFGFMRGEREGMFVGFLSGLLIDLFFGEILGFYALIYLLAGFCNGVFKRIFYPDDVKLPIFLIAVSDLSCNLLIYFFWFLFRLRLQIGYYLIHVLIPELVYTMIAAILLYVILLKINQKLEEIEKRSAKKFV